MINLIPFYNIDSLTGKWQQKVKMQLQCILLLGDILQINNSQNILVLEKEQKREIFVVEMENNVSRTVKNGRLTAISVLQLPSSSLANTSIH